jgi:hypothetical protein
VDAIVDRAALEENPSLGAAPPASPASIAPQRSGKGGRPPRAPGPPPPAERQYCCGPGSVFGGTDFVLQRPRSFRAVASAPTRVVAIGREQYRQCVRSAPEAAAFLQVGAR